MVELLTSDAVLAMPPLTHEYVGPAAIRAFIEASHRWLPERRIEVVPLRANTQPAFLHLLADRDTDDAGSLGVVVLTLAGDRVQRITRFLHEGLVDLIAGDAHGRAERTTVAVDSSPDDRIWPRLMSRMRALTAFRRPFVGALDGGHGRSQAQCPRRRAGEVRHVASTRLR